ncbi:ferredoxin [Mycobacterium sp. PDNC021]|uniref:ferredoxin n=1 Tax=Mycobacterium sp. PDNC021 TaxID=3391399 RepID=UPI003AAEA970
MRIEVDLNLCESNAVCVGMAPELFDLDENDFARVLVDEVPADVLVAARQVVASCPVGALRLQEDAI